MFDLNTELTASAHAFDRSTLGAKRNKSIRLLPFSRQQLGNESRSCAMQINTMTIRAFYQLRMLGRTRPSLFQESHSLAKTLLEALTMIRQRAYPNIAFHWCFPSACSFPSASLYTAGLQNVKCTGWSQTSAPVSLQLDSSYASTVLKRTSSIPTRPMRPALPVRLRSSGQWRASRSRCSHRRCMMHLVLDGATACWGLLACSWDLLHLWFYGDLAAGCEVRALIVQTEWSAHSIEDAQHVQSSHGKSLPCFRYSRICMCNLRSLSTFCYYVDPPTVTQRSPNG